MKKVLTIAGSDCSGGAGIQADIKTISAHKMYAMSVITALTAQNTVKISGIHDVPPDFVSMQMDSIFTDIFPDSVKTGMLLNAEIIKAVSDRLRHYGAKNIVIDPVMVSTSGRKLLSDDAIEAMTKNLLPLAALTTPNIPEAEVLSGINIKDPDGMIDAAVRISSQAGTPVLVKGGHLECAAVDILCENGIISTFSSERVKNPNTHGTGCTLSSAIACGLAKGLKLTESIKAAKEYLTGALKVSFDIGSGSGPVDHLYRINAPY